MIVDSRPFSDTYLPVRFICAFAFINDETVQDNCFVVIVALLVDDDDADAVNATAGYKDVVEVQAAAESCSSI